MKVIGFCGSPRKEGNSDLTLSAFLAGAEAAGAETKKIYLTDLELCGCDACYVCRKTGDCHHNDDLAEIVRTLPDYDVWALATPVYWWSASMPAKCFVDRLFSLCYGPNPKRVRGNKFVLITASADPPREATPHLKGAMKKSIDFLGLEWAGEIAVQALKKGEVKKNPEVLEKARKLGKKLAKGTTRKPGQKPEKKA